MHRKESGVMLHKNFAFKAESVKDDGTFAGYGSVFGNVDSYDEIVAPGAFSKSLATIKDSGDPLPVLWQHNPDEPIGGYTKLSEDDHGLKVEGFLLKNEVPRAAQAYALMKNRIVKGLSIGYYVRGDSYDEKSGVRTLNELDLREISVVTFPANESAQVDSVKSAIRGMLEAGALPSIKNFEDFLREAGFSKTQAAAIAVHGLSKLHRGEPDSTKGDDILAALRGFKLTPNQG
jgi:HK97 family phage prohead protease